MRARRLLTVPVLLATVFVFGGCGDSFEPPNPPVAMPANDSAPPSMAGMNTPDPRCRFRADWPNVAWVYVDPAIPEKATGHPPGSVYFSVIERNPVRWPEENEDYPHVLRADCDFANTGAIAWIELEPANPDDEWFQYVRVHPSARTSDAWFFTYWHNGIPDPPVGAIANLYVGNEAGRAKSQGGRRVWQQEVLVGVTQDADDSKGSYFCLGCTEDPVTGELTCQSIEGFCRIP